MYMLVLEAFISIEWLIKYATVAPCLYVKDAMILPMESTVAITGNELSPLKATAINYESPLIFTVVIILWSRAPRL